MIEKHLLVIDRVRRPPAEGFSWVDRRFLRDFASCLSGDAVFLYFFLAAVSDRQGLSFYNNLNNSRLAKKAWETPCFTGFPHFSADWRILPFTATFAVCGCQ